MYPSTRQLVNPSTRQLVNLSTKCIVALCVVLLAGCSPTKLVPDGSYMLSGVEVKSCEKGFDATGMEAYVRQRGNSRWFSTLKIPLGFYSIAGRDTTRWINRTLRRAGEPPIIYDEEQALQSKADLEQAMRNKGWLNAKAELRTKTKGKRIQTTYELHPGLPYTIGDIRHMIADDVIDSVLTGKAPCHVPASVRNQRGIQSGDRLSVEALENERKRIVTLLTANGFYQFHKDFISFSADTMTGKRQVDLTVRIEGNQHPRYRIGKVCFHSGDSAQVRLRQHILENNTAITEGSWYSAADLQKTYNNFARLQAVRYTSIRFKEVAGEPLLDCDVQVSTNKQRTISFQPEGTNTSGNLGAAASLTYENRNLFKGSELLTIQVRAAFEAITGLEGYQNEDYEEYGVETKLTFPHFLGPFSKDFRRRSTATTEFSLSYNMQDRPEFHRRLLQAAWRYRWTVPARKASFRFDLLDMNYVYMPWISQTFKEDYLDNSTSRNAILRYNYEDLFIMKTGFSMSVSMGNHYLRTNVETAGNLLGAVSAMTKVKRNDNGQRTLFNIAYAQYAKADIDYSRLVSLDAHNSIALHAGLGIAVPYGNSKILPFEKRYFSGGANSVRGWDVRSLGPGKFKGTDGRIDFINQTGDMKLDLNMEYRTRLFWKIDGAAFVDAGNIWTLRKYDEQPGGEFRFDTFFKQIAASYGTGLRFNFDYFIVRLDAGMKAYNPAGEDGHERFALAHPKFSRDFAFHFAVGLPF